MKTLYITPDSPWENGHVGSSNGKLADELLSEGFDRAYNTMCPYAALGYRPSAHEAFCVIEPISLFFGRLDNLWIVL